MAGGDVVTSPVMQPSQRIHLSVGLATPLKVLASVIALLFIGASGVFMILALGVGEVSKSAGNFADNPLVGGTGGPFDDPYFSNAPMPMPNTEPFEQASSFVTLFTRLLSLCGIPFVLIGVYLLLHVWRNAAWLDGAAVTKRGALLSRRVDLTTAEVAMGGINYTQHHQHGLRDYQTLVRLPALALTEVSSGRTTKIPLRGQGLDLLPASQLSALADALDQNRSVSAERARAIAAHLRSLAADPLAY